LVLTSQHSSASLLQSGGGVLKAILEIRVRVFFSLVCFSKDMPAIPVYKHQRNFANRITANCHICERSGNLTNLISQLICDLRTQIIFADLKNSSASPQIDHFSSQIMLQMI
jgi:hypothetical protein